MSWWTPGPPSAEHRSHGAAVLALLCLVLVATGCGPGARTPSTDEPAREAAPWDGLGDGDTALVIAPGGQALCLEVARSPAKRALGMMGREVVPEGTGMLFLMGSEGPHSFWMLNCVVSLDIVWLDPDGLVIDVRENVPPCAEQPCENYKPGSPALNVIEVGAGRARELGLVPGARVRIQPARCDLRRDG